MQSQAVEGTTDINSLPNELSQGNVVMNVTEKNTCTDKISNTISERLFQSVYVNNCRRRQIYMQ